MDDKLSFVGPAITAQELAEVIKMVQEHGVAAGIAKHLELAEAHEEPCDFQRSKPQTKSMNDTTNDPAVINGKRYSLWPQFVAKKDEWIGGILQDQADSDALALGMPMPEGGWHETEITDIRFEPNGETSAMFSVEGKDFGCGSDVQVLYVDPSGEQGWLTFGGYGGQKFRIKKPADKTLEPTSPERSTIQH